MDADVAQLKHSNNKYYASTFKYIDIDVFICMGFVLVDLFDKWVYSFYNGGYLCDENLRVLAF